MNSFDFNQDSRWYKIVSRIFIMLMFAVVGYFTIWLVVSVAVVQLVYGMFCSEGIHRLKKFSPGLNAYLHHIAQFLTGDTNERPFPFSEWPVVGDDENENKTDENE